MKWMLIEIKNNGEKVALPHEYDTYDEACEVQEMKEDLNPWNGYLIYTDDEWVYEMENGRA